MVDVLTLFASAGPVRALCRGLDWDSTPLGSVRKWPLVLRAMVRVVMQAPMGMAVL